ncbi:integrin alpha-D [Melanotaenia boesemani]|uniref:integrin alpha-D n=1 Tax=Melanotaenia boesemani TaxID=1250792 RepID=UPI001C04434A|nr:integrin alpha-D [Melanotaenia boesemani]
MSGLRRASLLIYMKAAAAVITVSLAFNIDTTHTDIYPGKKSDFFGYKVLQVKSTGSNGIIVTAPLHLNGSGGIFKYDENENKKEFTPKENAQTNSTVQHLGLSIAADPTRSNLTVCSPSLVHECYQNMFLNSVCYKITQELEQISSFKPAFQECRKKTVDLIFLFDGSKSMTDEEFGKNKFFIVNIMESLKNTSIKFAAAQFSDKTRKVFDFNDFKAGTAYEKLEKEPHMLSLTNTYTALKFVLNELFENPAAGASPDATKVLMIITDGDPSEPEDKAIIEQYNKKNIIRFVILVEKQGLLRNFGGIPSEITNTSVFKIESYDKLAGILETFQEQIFKIEGNQVARAGEMTAEMSQSGFSAAFYKDNLILGSVGSNNWRGSIQEHKNQTEKEISDSEMKTDSYMGYSISVGEKDGVPLYFSGAPRFNHTGQVIFFKEETWELAQRLDGSQIGSYFGAELCSVDVNSDGNTDFLLVGAPMFYQPHEKKEGRIYIYTLTDEMSLENEFSVTAPSLGRFGTTISSLADLNGDGLRDVAVGAPLEDDNSGAVYIYLGDRNTGIHSTFSQRITGGKIEPSIKFFGQAIDGHIDLSDDGLPDIVVGSQGAAVVLRSKSIFNVMAHLLFYPKEISIEKIDCLFSKAENLPMISLTVCFEMEETTKSKQGAAKSGMNISYTLSVDPIRKIHRGFFSPTDEKARTLTSSYKLTDKETCFNYSIFMPHCVKDTLSAVNIMLNFSQNDSENANVILNPDSKRQAVVEVPFEKYCRNKDICVADLDVDFNFTSATVLVTEANYFNVSIEVTNHGDDSYNTSLTMHYPPGLSYSMMSLTEATRPTLPSCRDLEGVLDKTVCGISLPVYRSRSFAKFKASFQILNDFKWNDTMTMTIVAQSDNSNVSSSNSLTKTIPVQFEIKMAITIKEETVTYLNFTEEDTAPKKIVIIYKINNPGFKGFPVNVSLIFPTKLEDIFVLTNYRVHVDQNITQCSGTSEMKSEYWSPEEDYKAINCDIFNLEKYSFIEFRLVGDVQYKDLKQHVKNIALPKRYTGDSKEVKFRSLIRVDYDTNRYVLATHKHEQPELQKDNDPTMKWVEARIELIILPDMLLIILTGGGLGLLLLFIIALIMLKLGCFKRKTQQDFEVMEDRNSTEQCQPSEKEKLVGVDQKESDQDPPPKRTEETNGHKDVSQNPS